MNRLIKNKLVYIALLVVLPALLLTDCSGGGGNVDTAPPEIVTKSPDPDDILQTSPFPVNTNVSVAFNKSVLNINNTTFYIEKIGSYGKVNATLQYDDSTKSAVLDPADDLDPDAIYLVTIISSVTSRAGVPLQAVSWTFTTSAESDLVPPAITAKTPNVQVSVDKSTELSLTFSEVMNSTTISSSSFYLSRQINETTWETVPSTVSYEGISKKATLTLTSPPLEEWKVYRLNWTDSIKDPAGNSLAADSFTFKTNDESDPAIISKIPDNGAGGVSTNATITVVFSESLKSSTIHNNPLNFKLEKCDPTCVAVDTTEVAYNDLNKTATLSPSSGTYWENSKNYQVTLADSITDHAGNGLAGSPVVWTFTTGALSDTTPPAAGSFSPANSTANVDLSTYSNKVTAVFSESVTGVDAASFILEKVSDSSTVSANVVYITGTKTAELTPLISLAEGTSYRARLTTSIKDVASNALPATSWTFTTADLTSPSVVTRSPISGAGNVASNSSVTVTFSEHVIGISAASYTVDNTSTSAQVSGSIEYTQATRTAQFIPDLPFEYDTEYTVTLTTAIEDPFTNDLPFTSWNFTTGSEPDNTAPVIVSPTYPDHSSPQTGIPISASVSVVFSEPVAGVSSSNIQLKIGGAGGSLVPARVTYDSLQKTAVLSPDSALLYGTVYTVVVKGGSGIKDAALNEIATDIYWAFTTIQDSTAPTVTFKNPEQGTSGIPGNAVSVYVVFSEQVQSVNDVSFNLKNVSTGDPVACDVAYNYNPSTNIASATLTPLADITTTGEYRVTLTNAIKDNSAAQNPLTEVTWTFFVAALDVTSPTTIVRQPGPSGTWTGNKVTVIFSEPVKWVNGTSFYVKDDADNTLTATVSYSESLLTAELITSELLPFQKTFTAYLTNAITDKAGNQMVPVSWTFSTPADNIAPTVTSVYPPDGTVAYPVNGQITVNFSELIQYQGAATIETTPAATFTYIPSTGQTNTVTLNPVGNLIGNTTYTVHVKTGIKDVSAAQNALAAEYTFQFTTQTLQDTTPPTIVGGSRYPSNGSSGIPLSTNITVQFSEDVQNADESGKIVLKQGTSQIAATVTYDGSFTATIDPVENLIQSTTYTVTVKGGSTGIKDMADNYLAADETWSFTTEVDNTPPQVVTTSPVSDGTGVPLRPAITVVFSEPVTGVDSNSCTLWNGGTQITPLYVLYDESTMTATLTPGNNLNNTTSYQVRLSNAIRDTKLPVGNQLVAYQWNFTTNSLPVIQTIETSTDGTNFTTAADGALTVNYAITHIRLTFNRNMNTEKQWLVLTEGAANPSPAVVGQWTWSSPNPTQVTYVLTGRCKGGTAYQAKLYGWGGTFEDPDGNTVSRTAYVGDGIFNFTTTADATAPAVDSSIPSLGTSVGLGAQTVGRNIPYVILRFNEMMNTGRASVVEIRRDSTGTWRACTGPVWFEGGRSVRYTIPNDGAGDGLPLLQDTNYRIRLGNTTSFQDFAGQNMAVTTLYFKSGASTGAVAVAGTADSFETYSYPNFSYFMNVSGDTGGDWARSSLEKSGNNTTLTIPNGAYLVKGSSWDWAFDTYADINYAGAADFSTAGTYILTFSMFHERIFSHIDRLQVWVSTDGANYTQVKPGALMGILRYDWTFANDSPVWQVHYVDLSSYAGFSGVWVRLRARSAGERGGNIIIDNAAVTKY